MDDVNKNELNAKHWVIITNPKAGKRSFQSQTNYVTNRLKQSNIKFTLKVTEYAGHAIEIARDFANNAYSNFLILGGDGTINEVINGLFLSSIKVKSKLKIAIIPRGTGNDWARFWKLTKNTDKNITYFLAGKTKTIDIGQINYSVDGQVSNYFFINSVGFGIDANVAQLTNHLKKYLGSFSFLYTISLLVILTKLRSYQMSINIDGKSSNLMLLSMNIANGPYTGGGIKQNPDALPFDAVFDMMYVEKLTFKDILKLSPNLFNGKLKEHKRIHSLQSKKIEIEFEEAVFSEADGITLPKSTSYSVEILPNSIQMIVP